MKHTNQSIKTRLSMNTFLLLIPFWGMVFSYSTLGHEGGERSTAKGEKGILLVAMGPSNNLVMIDIATERVMKAIAGPVNPHGIAVTPDGKYAYLTSRNPDEENKSAGDGPFEVSVVDLEQGKVATTIDVGGDSHHAWISPDGKQVYVTVPALEGISVIDTATNSVVNTVKTGFKANSVATSPDGKRIYVVNKGDDTLSVIDRESLAVAKTLNVGKGPDHITVSPDGTMIYLTATYANEIWAIQADPLSVAAKAKTDKGPHGIAVSGDGQYVLVASRGGATLSMFRAPELKMLYSKPLGKGPGHIAVAPGGNLVYVNDEVESKTYIYDPDTQKVIHTIHLWPEPHETAFFIPPQ